METAISASLSHLNSMQVCRDDAFRDRSAQIRDCLAGPVFCFGLNGNVTCHCCPRPEMYTHCALCWWATRAHLKLLRSRIAVLSVLTCLSPAYLQMYMYYLRALHGSVCC